tara:strand:+ start:11 stop:685 length:675 start_codon:yes stop_codon:yes gene_type:complete
MENKIWFFGDSFTYGDGCVENRPPNGEYYKIKPHGVLWREGVADHFKMGAINRSIGGASNDWIINSLIDELLNIQPNDIVVVGITWPERFQIIDKKNNEHRNVIAHHFTELPETSTLVLDHKDRKYNKELFELLNMFFIEYRVQHGPLLKKYQWNQALKILKKLEQSNVKFLLWDLKVLWDYETIDDVIGNGDRHWSWKGHNDWMLKCIDLLENNQTELVEHYE